MKKNALIITIMFIAVFLRLYTVFFDAQAPKDDALEYDVIACNIVSGNGYVIEGNTPTSFRPPLYPFVLAIIYYFFGHSYLAVFVFQTILGVATVFLIYKIGCLTYSRKAGILASFFVAIYPSYIILTRLLFTETVFIFLLTFSVFLFIRIKNKGSMFNLICLGFILSAMTLTRPSAVFLPFIYGILFITLNRDRAFKTRIIYTIFMILVFFAAISPWIYRNVRIHDRFVLISTNGGLNFYQAVSPINGKIFGKVPDDKNIQESKKIKNESDRDKFLFNKGLEKTLNSPVRTTKLMFLRSLFYWGFFDWEVQTGNEYNFMYGFILPFFILGSIFSLKNIKKYIVPIIVILYFSSLVIFSQGVVRYRLPTDGLMFLVGAFAIMGIFEKIKLRIAVVSIICAYFSLNVLFYLNSETIKEMLKSVLAGTGLW